MISVFSKIEKMIFKNKSYRLIHNEISRFFVKNEFFLLLVTLLSFILLPSFFTKTAVKNHLIYGLLISVLVVGVYELAESKRSFYIGALLAFSVIVLNAFELPVNKTLLFLLRMGSLTIFFLMLTRHVLLRMMKVKMINTNVIYAAVSGYLLIGLIGGMGFRLIDHFYPHSFVLGSGLDAKIDDLTYFSFITLSTLGYGDITPVTPPGQSLAVFISICGQMYVAIVIGIIIGKFIRDKNGNV